MSRSRPSPGRQVVFRWSGAIRVLFWPCGGMAEARGSPDSGEGWEQSYVAWECGLPTALGFGLDLGRCAVTGTSEDLAYVSPRTGRAVSRSAGTPYHDKLLPLPGFLWREAPATRPDI